MKRLEDRLHISVRDFLNAAYPSLRWWTVLNGGFAIEARQGAKSRAHDKIGHVRAGAV